jgi:predicted RNase H-like HicB family nuclease
LAYHLAVLVPLPSGQWRTDIPDFPGCSAEHSSALTAMSRAREHAEAMATEFVKRGEGLPRPRDLQSIIAEGPSREDPA